MERTEKEKTIKRILLELIGNAGNHLMVDFISASDARQCRPGSSTVVREYNAVRLILYESDVVDNLNSWEEALVKAEELIDLIERENIHERNHPNFFKAMEAHYKYLKGRVSNSTKD